MAVMFSFRLLIAFLLPLVSALKFEIQAHPGHESSKHERCIRNFVAKDQLVVVTTKISGSRGDGQVLNLHVCEAESLFPCSMLHSQWKEGRGKEGTDETTPKIGFLSILHILLT